MDSKKTILSPSQKTNIPLLLFCQKSSLQFKTAKSTRTKGIIQFSNDSHRSKRALDQKMVMIDRSSQLSAKENISPFSVKTNKALQFSMRIQPVSVIHHHHHHHQQTTIHHHKQNSFSKTLRHLTNQKISPFVLQAQSPRPMPMQSILSLSLFTKIRYLGKGKFGEVHLVRHNASNFLCAMKIIKKSVITEEHTQLQISRQLRIHNTLNHLNIIQFYGFFADSLHFYILTEYATEGELYSNLKKTYRLPQDSIPPIIQGAVRGLQKMHHLGYIHRDMKPENILMQFGVTKICDLGWAVECKREQMRRSYCGTPLYLSPQMVRREEYNGQTDVWAVGVLTYEMLVGRIPFKLWSESDLPVILQQDVVIPPYIDVTHTCEDFIRKCLEKQQSQRIKIDELIKHPFIGGKTIVEDITIRKQIEAVLTRN